MNGKIARLPQSIRDQLNRRLDEGEPQHDLRAWLNSLPEVQALLGPEFGPEPISKQNLYEWTQHSFRNWKVRQNAFAFATLDAADALAPESPSHDLSDKLVQWLAIRFAASAHTLAPVEDDDPETDLRRLRHFAADVVALRRGDLCTRRLELEQRRLGMLEAKSREKHEAEFWEWTKRPDIRAKLRIERDQSKFWNDYLRATIPEITPFLPKDPAPFDEPDETLAPAALI
jgi:hypothetical protein